MLRGGRVFRVQDALGRGPYRPGFSHVWSDVGHGLRNPSIFDDFGHDIAKKMRPGRYYGCAFGSIECARKWFSTAESKLLEMLSYQLVSMRFDEVIGESPRQLIIARNVPLRTEIVHVPWDVFHEKKAA
jgi:hypothetical protein